MDPYLDSEPESYYRYLKALHFFLAAALRDHDVKDIDLATPIEDIMHKLEEYELPLKTKSRLFRYYEMIGSYARAEDVLFEMVEAEEPAGDEEIEQGIAFYQRLLKKSDADLSAGNMSREEVEEGLAQLRAR